VLSLDIICDNKKSCGLTDNLSSLASLM
jgi:hypothetical protein